MFVHIHFLLTIFIEKDLVVGIIIQFCMNHLFVF